MPKGRTIPVNICLNFGSYPVMIALLAYVVVLFLLGLGNAVVTYHILRYRDDHDIAGIVLAIYYLLALVILVATAFLIDFNQLLTYRLPIQLG